MSLSKSILSKQFEKSKKISLLSKSINGKTSNLLKPKDKETPLCISMQASYTVEAAVVLPIFVCAVVMVLFFFRIYVVECSVNYAMDTTCRRMACCGSVDADIDEETKSQGTMAAAVAMCNGQIILRKTPVYYIEGGILGIDYSKSNVEENYINLVANYYIKFPVEVFGQHVLKVCQQSVSRKWIGWDPTEDEAGEGYVYVTKYGTAYHKNIKCSYLNPSIQLIDYQEIKNKRNSSGGRYYACPLCKAKKIKQGNVYITDYGDVYHCKLGCSGLKRTVLRILFEEATQYHPCNKCVSDGGDQ